MKKPLIYFEFKFCLLVAMLRPLCGARSKLRAPTPPTQRIQVAPSRASPSVSHYSKTFTSNPGRASVTKLESQFLQLLLFLRFSGTLFGPDLTNTMMLSHLVSISANVVPKQLAVQAKIQSTFSKNKLYSICLQKKKFQFTDL